MSRWIPSKVAVAVTIGLLTPFSVSAQDQSEKSTETMVVTASGFEQSMKEAPASISVISREDLEKGSYTSIVDAVSNIPGVYVTGGGNSQDISIRGMAASYTLYMIDGRPISAGRSVNTNGQDGGKQISLPSLSMIERIEVIRGPMSSLYGSEAMGGVINIITRKGSAQWGGSITTEYTKSLNDINNDNQTVNLFVAGPLIPDLLSMKVNGSWYGADESDYVGGTDFAESTPEVKRRQGGVALVLTPDDHNEFTVSYDNSRQDTTHTEGKSTASSTSEYIYQKDTYLISYNGKYDDLFVDAYVQHDISENVQDQTKQEKMTILNAQGSYFLGDHVVTLGGQYKQEQFIDETNGLLTSNIPGAERETDRWIAALYAEADWRVLDDLSITTGLRYDDDELFGGHLSPRIYGVYTLTPEWTVKGGVSTGYKQPSLTSATEGFGRGTGGSGSPAAYPRALIIGNSDLKPEKSINYELGLNFDQIAWGLNSNINLFYTEFKDKISEERLCESPNGDRNNPDTWACGFGGNNYFFLSTYKNIDEAVMKGVEFSVNYRLTQDIKLTASYTYTDSEQKTGDFKGEPLNKMPEHMLNLAADWQASENLSLWLKNNIRSETSDYLSRTSMYEGTPGYGTVDIGLMYQLSNRLRAKAAIYNLGNKEITDETYGVVLDGRNLNLGLTVDF